MKFFIRLTVGHNPISWCIFLNSIRNMYRKLKEKGKVGTKESNRSWKLKALGKERIFCEHERSRAKIQRLNGKQS